LSTTLDMDAIRLGVGSHSSFTEGVCIMELAAFLAGRSITDRPACVSPVIGSFLRTWNDQLEDEPRQQLKPYAPLVLNTATGSEDELTRSWLATDWLVRECAPAFLRKAGLTEQAGTLAALPALTGSAIAAAAQPQIDEAAESAAAARDAARAAAGAALEPTVKQLQASALLLLDRMIEVGKTA
jgi:hypothetical protein